MLLVHAVVEIMGHRTRAGAIADAQLGGATLLRIEHPSVTGHDGEPLAEYYAPSAVFAIHPCSPEDAKRAAEMYWRSPYAAGPPALSPAFAELVDEEDEETDDYGEPLR